MPLNRQAEIFARLARLTSARRQSFSQCRAKRRPILRWFETF